MGVLLGLVITAALIVLVADWRPALLSLALHYVLLGLLLTNLVPASIALVRVVAGGLAVAILYLSMRNRVEQDKVIFRHTRHELPETVSPRSRQVFVIGFPFRFVAVAFVTISIMGIASSMAFFGLPAYVFFASVWLMAIGLLTAILARDTLRLGLGILLFSGGFSVLDTAVEGSLFLYGLVNIADLLIALAVGHLATLPGDAGEHRGGEDAL